MKKQCLHYVPETSSNLIVGIKKDCSVKMRLKGSLSLCCLVTMVSTFLKHHGNKIYDFFAIFISLLDLTTDILVLYSFHQEDRRFFFITSLIILLIAQISYLVAFANRYHDSSKPLAAMCMILLLLPFAPFVSIVMYVAEKKNWFRTAYNPESGLNAIKSPLQKWMDEKLRSHLGFILEATIEAFPQRFAFYDFDQLQFRMLSNSDVLSHSVISVSCHMHRIKYSILQMCAIVYYEEYNNVLPVLSILISMWSVSSKSLVFAAGTALDRFTMLFNWLCVIVDFFGIFFVISWVFHNEVIYNLFIYQFLIGPTPLALWITFCFMLFCMYETSAKAVEELSASYSSVCEKWCCLPLALIFGIPLVMAFAICSGAVLLMLLQIFHLTYPALIIYALGTKRYDFENRSNADCYNDILSWIGRSGAIRHGQLEISKAQDKIVRICSTNMLMIHMW